MGFLFSNPLFLAGLVGLGVPIALHLLLKRRNQRLRFSTNRFFLQNEEKASQKRKLRNLLLLSLRMLIFALLVMAFARPFLPISGEAAREHGREQAVLVLDRSLSMTAGKANQVRWNLGQKAARDYLGHLTGGDRVAVVTCADRASVAAGFGVPSVAAATIADLKPSPVAAELGLGLKEALRLLENNEPTLEKTIVVISDLQRTGTLNLHSTVLPKDVALKVISVGDLFTPNFAVTELNLEAHDERRPHATVVSYSDEDRAEVRTETWVDGARVQSRSVTLNSGESTQVELELPTMGPGWHPVEFRIQPMRADAMAADNARFQTVFVPEPVRVLSVEGRGGRRSFEAETFFINTALDAAMGAGTGTNVPSAFRVVRARPEELAERLRPAGMGGGKPSWDVVILTGPKGDSAEMADGLERFVKAGGGVLLFAGEGLTPLRFNNRFAAILPANLKSIETAGADTPWHIGEVDLRSPYFDVFAKTGAGDPSLAEFTHRYAMDVLEGSQWVGRFDDDAPFAVGREIGRGRVLLVNSSVDAAWNDWPKHKTFVPWLHRVVRHLAGRSTEEVARAGSEVATGTLMEFGTNRLGGSSTMVRWLKPDGTETTLKPGPDGRWPEVDVTVPGVHRWVGADGREIRRVAANVPPLESDLAAWKAHEFEGRVARSTEAPTRSLVGNLLGNGRNQKEFWRVLLLGALLLLIVETLWSNRTYV